MRFVIIGGGIAGTTAAEELRKQLSDAEITLIGEEQHALYSRVLLPHYVKGKVPRERVFLKKPDWYEVQRIEYLTGLHVDSCDTANKHVALSDGRELPYDKLLIATGGEVRLIPDDCRGVSYFRSLDDTDHLCELLATLPAGSPAAIYGGGFIACEYLNIFAQHNLPTIQLMRDGYFWPRALLPEMGKFLNDHLRAKGVEIVDGAASISLVGEKDLAGFSVKGKEYACRILGVGIGIAAELDWVKAAGIETGQGVKGNEYLETNVADIYTAGDVAEFLDVTTNRYRHVGNWMNAMMQGSLVAQNMAGIVGRKPFKLVSSYATNALGLEIIFVGDTSREHADEIVVHSGTKEEGMSQIFLRDKKVVGGVCIGRNKDRTPITKAIESGESLHL